MAFGFWPASARYLQDNVKLSLVFKDLWCISYSKDIMKDILLLYDPIKTIVLYFNPSTY